MLTLPNNKLTFISKLPVMPLSQPWIDLLSSSSVPWCSTHPLKGNSTLFTLNTPKTFKMTHGENIKWLNIWQNQAIPTQSSPLVIKPLSPTQISEKCFSISTTVITLQISWKWSFMESKMLINLAKSSKTNFQQSKTKSINLTKWHNIPLMKKCSRKWSKSFPLRIKEPWNLRGFWVTNQWITETLPQNTYHIF